MLLCLPPMDGREGRGSRTARRSTTSSRTPCATGAGTISVSTAARDGTVELRVSDEGPGLSAGRPLLGQAFDRFTRADPARGRGGSGRGLSIVRLIARAHDGDARAQNDLAGGATVSVTPPRP